MPQNRFFPASLIALLLVLGCSSASQIETREPTLAYRGSAIWMGQVLKNYTIYIYDAEQKRIGLTTTDDEGMYTIPVLANYGIHRIVMVGVGMSKPVELYNFVSIDDIAKDFVDFHINPLTVIQSALYKSMLDRGEAPQRSYALMLESMRDVFGFIPSDTVPLNTTASGSDGEKIAAWVKGLENLARFVVRKNNFGAAAPGTSAEELLRSIEDDIKNDGILDGVGKNGKAFVADGVQITPDLLRGEMASAVAEVVDVTSRSAYAGEIAAWLRSVAMKKGGFLTSYDSYYDIIPPVFTFPGTNNNEIIPEEKNYICRGSDRNRMRAINAWIEQNGTRYSEQMRTDVQMPQVEDYDTIVGFVRPELVNRVPVSLKCRGLDAHGNYAEASLQLTANTDRGQYDVSWSRVGNSDIIDITCKCPDELATCKITYPRAQDLQNCELNDDMHRCSFDSTQLRYDDPMPIVCDVLSPGLFPTTTGTHFTPDNFGPGSMRVQANHGFPIRQALIEVYQMGTTYRVDDCAGECRTSDSGAVNIGIKDLSAMYGTYNGYLEIVMTSGRYKSVEGEWNNSSTWRTLIAYEATKRGTNLGDVIINAETTIAAAFAKAWTIQQPTIDAKIHIEKAHLLMAQRLYDCTCINEFLAGTLIDNKYDEPGDACYIAPSSYLANEFNTGRFDIRKVIPTNLDGLVRNQLSTSFADKVALVHAGYSRLSSLHNVLANAQHPHPDSPQLTLDKYAAMLEKDASDGRWDGKNNGETIMVYRDHSLSVEEMRNFLAKNTSVWLEQNVDNIGPFVDGDIAVIRSIAQCSNALYDSGIQSTRYDARPPTVSLSTDVDVTSDGRVTVLVDALDDESSVERVVITAISNGRREIIAEYDAPSGAVGGGINLPFGCKDTRIEAFAVDASGRESAPVAVNVRCDNIPPARARFFSQTFYDYANVIPSYAGDVLDISRGRDLKETRETLFPLSFTTFVHTMTDDYMPRMLFDVIEPGEDSIEYGMSFVNNSASLAWKKAPFDAEKQMFAVRLSPIDLCTDDACKRKLIKNETESAYVFVRETDKLGNATAARSYEIKAKYRFAPGVFVNAAPSETVRDLSTTNDSLREFFAHQGQLHAFTVTFKNPITPVLAQNLPADVVTQEIDLSNTNLRFRGTKSFAAIVANFSSFVSPLEEYGECSPTFSPSITGWWGQSKAGVYMQMRGREAHWRDTRCVDGVFESFGTGFMPQFQVPRVSNEIPVDFESEKAFPLFALDALGRRTSRAIVAPGTSEIKLYVDSPRFVFNGRNHAFAFGLMGYKIPKGLVPDRLRKVSSVQTTRNGQITTETGATEHDLSHELLGFQLESSEIRATTQNTSNKSSTALLSQH